MKKYGSLGESSCNCKKYGVYGWQRCWKRGSFEPHIRVTSWDCSPPPGGHGALAFSPSGIAPELNRIQLSAICRGGQSGKVIDLLAWCCLPLGHPSAASGACAVIQNSPPYLVKKTGINMGHTLKIFKKWLQNRPNFINLISKVPKFAWKLNNFGK